VRVVVVAGSHLTAELDAAVVASADLLVAVDGGAEALSRVGLTPALLVGDLDSITVRTRETLEARGVEVVTLSTAKDETDTEAALRLLIARGADDLVIYGVLGGPRLDHLVGNLLLLSSPWLAGVRVKMVDGRHEVFLAKGDSTFAGTPGDIVSLLPLTPAVEDVRTEGLLYPLGGEILYQAATRGVSNTMVGAEARVTHRSGVLLMIHYRGR
jgi:thiamine pyrophosphokinase